MSGWLWTTIVGTGAKYRALRFTDVSDLSKRHTPPAKTPLNWCP